MSIGSAIKEARKKKGLTQKKLSIKAGIGLASLQRYESDERSANFDTLMKIREALGVNLVDLVGEENMGMYAKDIINDLAETAQNNLNDIKNGLSDIDLKDLAKPAIDALEELKNLSDEEKLIIYFDQLNDDGQKEAVRDVKKLTKIPEYKK